MNQDIKLNIPRQNKIDMNDKLKIKQKTKNMNINIDQQHRIYEVQ